MLIRSGWKGAIPCFPSVLVQAVAGNASLTVSYTFTVIVCTARMLPTTPLMRGAEKTVTAVVHVRSRHPIRSAVYQPACCNRDYAVCPMRSDGHKSCKELQVLVT